MTETTDMEAPLLQRAPADAEASVGPVADGGEDGGGAAPAHGGRRGAHWLGIAAILLADMFGIGTLGLPGDFARLGWLPALAAMALFMAGGVYSGSVYQRLSLRVPHAVVFDQIGAEAMGNLGRALVFGTIYLGILTEPFIFHYMTVESLQQMLFGFNLSGLAANAIVVALILPMAQMHHLEDVAWVALLGTAGMVIAVAVVVGKLLATFLAASALDPGAPGGAAAAPETELIARGPFTSALVGILDIAFAFGGQINWMRYITGMGDRRRFKDSVGITQAVMGSLYLLTGVVGYAALGKGMDVHRPISSVLPYDGWVAAMNAAIFCHCLIAYQVMVNVWSSSCLHIFAPTHAKRLSQGGGAAARSAWLGVTAACVALSVAAANAFPYFAELMSLIASLGDIMSMFGLPCVFAICLLKMSRAEVALCACLAVIAVALSGCGLASSLQQLAEAMRTGNSGGR